MRERDGNANESHHLQVVDHAALEEVLERLFKHFDGHRPAARAVGIEQSAFSRLLAGARSGKQKKIGARNYRRILDALTRIDLGLDPLEWLDFQDRFRDSVMPWAGRQIQAAYQLWVERELKRLHGLVGPLLGDLNDVGGCRDLFRRFQAKVAKRSDDAVRKKRIQLALLRAVEPMADASATYGVERSWQQMQSSEELLPFLKASLRREEIMLNRESDRDRLTKIIPDAFLADLAESGDDVPGDPRFLLESDDQASAEGA